MQAIMGFLAMGGYAAYVWPAYAVALLVLGGMTVQSLRTHRRNLRLLDALQQDRPGRRRDGSGR